MKTRHARQIRRGILEARKLFPNPQMSRLAWKAFCRETENYLKNLLKEKSPFV